MREIEIEKHLIKVCSQKKWLCLKFVSPNFTGVPDRIIIPYSGLSYFVEVKAPNKKPRVRQEKVLQLLKNHQVPVFVVSSKDEVDELIGIINAS
jgi:hypothetical protein